MNRRESRETVFCLLYELEYHPDSHYLDVYNLAKLSREIEENEYIRSTFTGTCEKIEEIDKIIESASVGWKTERMSKVSRAILRLGVYEILFGNVPFKAAINEAVDIAKKYDNESSPAFVNGILNKVAKQDAAVSEHEPQSEAESESEENTDENI